MIRCVGVYKSFELADQTVPALQGVDLEIPGDGFYGIMGQSGSGKSTLLHLLAALDRPDSGEVYVNGRAIHTLAERDATAFRRRQIGIVFQQFNLIPTLTARENVELPGILAGDSERFLRARSGELLERLGVNGRSDHRPHTMSGGEQQRVAIARALLYSPPVLYADEPTGNLDSATSTRMWSLLRQIAREHKTTVVMVTHEPLAAAHCQCVYVLQDGRVSGRIDTEGLDAAGVASRYQHCICAA